MLRRIFIYICCLTVVASLALLTGCQTRNSFAKKRYAVQSAYMSGQINQDDYNTLMEHIDRSEEKDYQRRKIALAFFNGLTVMGNSLKQQGTTSQYSPQQYAPPRQFSPQFPSYTKSTYMPSQSLPNSFFSGTENKGTYLGRVSNNKFDPESIANPYGAGNPFKSDGINNLYGRYGNRFSPYSINNPYTTSAPKLYDDAGNYYGRLSANRYDPDSISNPFGRYGNPNSPDSINNKFGIGNPYGNKLQIVGE